MSMSDTLLIKGATVVTMDAENNVYRGDVFIRSGRIAELGDSLTGSAYKSAEIIDGRGRVLIPGFVQTHVHLCQTLFRGAADDLSLIDWLRKRVWPMEAAHTAESVYASARLGIAELISGGTTCALTMETVQHTDSVFKAVEESGFRATVGKCMMDKGDDVPAALREETEASVAESVVLLERWHGRADGRIHCCFAPRFAISCSRQLLERVGRLSRERRIIIHTHASENRDEIALVERETGLRNIAYLNQVGLTSPQTVLAHCVHINDQEMEIVKSSGTHVAHCPSSNLKLGSGFARVPEMVERGISVSLGSDGAACNNRLDMFTEMRTAALIQKAVHGAEVLPALQMLRMATIGGAAALGLDREIGSIEVGKRADLSLVNIESLHTSPHPDPVSTLVYAAQPGDVETVLVDGRVLMRERQLMTVNGEEVLQAAREYAAEIRRALDD